MPLLLEKQRIWLSEHGERKLPDGWFCRQTGKPINAKSFTRTLHSVGSLDDYLTAPVPAQDRGAETQKILMLWCTACGNEPTKLVIDSPIVEVG